LKGTGPKKVHLSETTFGSHSSGFYFIVLVFSEIRKEKGGKDSDK
jgi:hypothetical protein